MANAYQHFLITRFNIGYTNPEKRDKNRISVNTKDYLHKRLILFDNITRQSVRTQSKQDFTWFVGFDNQTPENLKEILQYIDPNVKWIEANTNEEFLKIINEYVTAEHLLTTRIDSDDEMRPFFIEWLHNAVNKYCLQKEPTPALFTFPKGLVTDLTTRDYMIYTDINNSFVSLLEHIDPPAAPDMVYRYPYPTITEHYPTTIITVKDEYGTELCMWNIISHSCNLHTDYHTLLRRFKNTTVGNK